MKTETFEIHPKTGRPIRHVEPFKAGELGTLSIGGDAYPVVVVKASASGKTVWVRHVRAIHHNEGSFTIDPESVERALADPFPQDYQNNPTKFVLYTAPVPVAGSFNEQDKYGGTHHRRYYRQTGADYCRLSHGVRSRRDPHF